MSKVATEVIKEKSVLSMYRFLVKNLIKYPSINRAEVYVETKRVFRANKQMINADDIEKEIRKTRLAVAHVEAYIGQSDQLSTKYRNSGVFSDNSLNPKDEHFVYF